MNELKTLKQTFEKEVGVSCLCGTRGCNGSQCNPLAFDAAVYERAANVLLKRATLTPAAIWAEFLRNAAADAGITTMENFLGSVKKYEKIFLNTATQLERATNEITSGTR